MTKTKQKTTQEEAKSTKDMTHSMSQKATETLKHFKKHFEPKKVDEFQEKWLKVPENRKKYKKITDAPQVAAEEVLAMTNDLIQYIQGQKGGQSKLLEKLKKGVSGFVKNPAAYVKARQEASNKAKKEGGMAKASSKEIKKPVAKKTQEK